MDDHGHGTHCAGIIGAAGNNTLGMAGASWQVGLLGCKFMDSTGVGYMSGIIKCIDFCLRNNATISSNSYALQGVDRDSSVLRDAIEQAAAQDHLFIAAAGNDGQNNDLDDSPSFPAAFELGNMISVAALEEDMNGNFVLSAYSNYGNRTTHVAAPGTDIISAWPGGWLAYLSGTSMVG